MRLRLSKAPVAETMRADAEAVARHAARLDAADPLD
jgi:hypothetical protein